MFKKFLVLSAVFVLLLTSYGGSTQAATIIDKSQVYMYIGEKVKTTRKLYLPSGARIGIYVQEYEDPNNVFHWWLLNEKGTEVDWDNKSSNRFFDGPPGYYTLQVNCGKANCRGNAILSIQK